MKKHILAILVALIALFSYGGSALAAEYNFSAANHDDFYRSTLYEDMYGSAYNYGGSNVVDFTDTTALLPGIISPRIPTAAPAAETIRPASPDTEYYSNVSNNYAASSFSATISGFTPSSELLRSDGSIGTLVIPSLDINMKVYEGATNQSMSKGLGHFSDTSAWAGNIGLCGHNRGAKYTIGSIKKLDIGDIIRYSTKLGTREYAVTFVGAISDDDWTYLAASADNRITIITCVENYPESRICVTAKEVK